MVLTKSLGVIWSKPGAEDILRPVISLAIPSGLNAISGDTAPGERVSIRVDCVMLGVENTDEK